MMAQRLPIPASRLVPVLAVLAPLALASCQSGGGPVPHGAPPASRTTFYCSTGERLLVEYQRPVVRVTVAEAAPVELPASPPGSHSRFGDHTHALVIEGREALYIVSGKRPLTCRR